MAYSRKFMAEKLSQVAVSRQLSPDENQERMTASIMYSRPFHDGNSTSTLIWGRTRSLPDNAIFNSYASESTMRVRSRNYVWTRIENVDRSNEPILGENPLPPNFLEQPIGRVQTYTFGYDRDFDLIPRAASALGAQGTARWRSSEIRLWLPPSRRGRVRAIPALVGGCTIIPGRLHIPVRPGRSA